MVKGLSNLFLAVKRGEAMCLELMAEDTAKLQREEAKESAAREKKRRKAARKKEQVETLTKPLLHPMK